jgi:hypothetical protein
MPVHGNNISNEIVESIKTTLLKRLPPPFYEVGLVSITV